MRGQEAGFSLALLLTSPSKLSKSLTSLEFNVLTSEMRQLNEVISGFFPAQIFYNRLRINKLGLTGESVSTWATLTRVCDHQSFLWLGQAYQPTGSGINENEQSHSSVPQAKAVIGCKRTDTHTVSRLDTGTYLWALFSPSKVQPELQN